MIMPASREGLKQTRGGWSDPIGSRWDPILRRSPAQWYFRARSTRRLVVLAYHDVADPDGFRAQLDFVRTVMHPISLAEAVAAINGGRRLPPKSVLVTFDDGDPSVYEHALPILTEYEVPAVAFVVAGLIGADEPLWWVEVEDYLSRGAEVRGISGGEPNSIVRQMKKLPNDQRLARIDDLRVSVDGPPVRARQLTAQELLDMVGAGVAIGNHTLTHPCLDRCSDEVVRREVIDAHEILTDLLGEPPAAFAYPNGNFDARVVPVLSNLQYDAAFLFDHRLAPFPPGDEYRISRIRVSSTASLDRFEILLSGLHSWLHHRVLGRS